MMPKRIKILYTIPNFDTAGSGKVVYDLVKHVNKEHYEPHICCMHSKGAFFSRVKTLGVPIHIFNFSVPYRPFLSLPYRIWQIRRFFKTHDFDLIHSWHWSSDITEPLAAKLAGIPFVYTKKAMGWGNRSWRWRSQLSSKIITINSDMERQFFSAMRDKVVPIPIGLKVEGFGILDKTYQHKDGYAVAKDDFVIVSIANLVPVKGIELLLDAVTAINSPKIKVFIVGDKNSDYGQNLEKTYASNTIIFTGKQQHIKDYLALADVFVIPTKDEGRKEGQPIAPIEAMLCGRVVLGSNVSGIKDVLEPFPNCMFQPDAVTNLSAAIEWVMQMGPKERLQLAQEMYAFAAQQYTIEKSIARHEDLYVSCLHKNHKVFRLRLM